MLIQNGISSQDNSDLGQIILQAQKGESSAFGELYDRYAGHIVRYLYIRTREPESAKDLTQEVFMRVMKGIRTLEYRGEKSFLGWLYTIASNVLIGQARRKQSLSTPLDESIDIVDPRSHEHVVSAFERVLLQHAMSQLTSEQQQVLTLKFFADLTNQEIASVLGKSEGAIKGLQYRALQSLQQILEREYLDPGTAGAIHN